MPLASDWTQAAIRLHQRYMVEVVEACGFCPWAQSARLEGHTRHAVLLQEDAESLAPSLAAIDAWRPDESVEVGFLLYPGLSISHADFERFVARVRREDALRYAAGGVPFHLADFHPEAEPDLDHADRLVPFLRCTPDPSIQVVRASAIERAVGEEPEGTLFVDLASGGLAAAIKAARDAPVPVRDRVGQANLETVKRLGVEELRARFRAIRKDRDETYRALLMARSGSNNPGESMS